MASAYVPPAPTLDNNFDFSTQLNSPAQSNEPKQANLSQNGLIFLDEIDSEGVTHQFYSQSCIQRVPETPLLQQEAFPTPRLYGIPNGDECLNFSFDTANGRDHIGLRPVTEIPEWFQSIFREFTHFNFVQSKVLDDVLYTDHPLVTSAPTGSGKTVIFELAIVRLLMQSAGTVPNGKIVYVAPIKALCSERHEDWKLKFGSFGLNCCELTGDSQLDDYFELQKAHIVMTTPEKWDSMTRKWRDYKSLVQQVQLFLIDEVHQLNDETRGPTMEAIVSRMKTIQASSGREERPGSRTQKLRFIAISATIPNIADVAAWLGPSTEVAAHYYSIDETHRPVRLRRVVLGYPDASTEFKFDLALNYRLGSVIQIYSDQKPSLVFCATRKGTQQAASVLVKEARFVMNGAHKQRLQQTASSIRDAKLRELVLYGVGYHHAGMDITDRKTVEAIFTAGDLPVLFATSTLAMGVNLPAHLVVIKSTMHYISGMYQECSESQILQMIGRAGRPQFDSTATAVIMTRNSTKSKYEALLNGKQLIESNLHRNLIEHLNAEIVLHTITDVTIALEWLHSTFFYIRVKQNPQNYGMPKEVDAMEEKLQKLCLKNLQLLESCSLVKMDDGLMLQHTDKGRLMARYCVAFESMKRFLNFKGTECLAEMINQMSMCKEFEDVRLRVNEKKVLNILNKDKNRPTIRFSLPGKVKSTDMKVNCLIQATLGCLPVQEFALNQDIQKIMRASSRLSKCLMELEMIGDNFRSLLNAVILHKCIQARLWENSKHVAKQLDKIGLHLSTTLVNADLTTFQKILDTGPREIELIMNRHPPFGNQIRDAVSLLPQYKVEISQVSGKLSTTCELEVTIILTNHMALKDKGATWGAIHSCVLLIGDNSNKVLCKQRISDSQLLDRGNYTRKLVIQRSCAGDALKVHYISLEHVGVDAFETFTPKYTTTPISMGSSQSAVCKQRALSSTPSYSANGNKSFAVTKSETSTRFLNGLKTCNHKCLNKSVCGHECCKNGVQSKSGGRGSAMKKINALPTVKAGPKPTGIQLNQHANQLHSKVNHLPATPVLSRIKPNLSVNEKFQFAGKTTAPRNSFSDRFSYTPRPSFGSKYSSTCTGNSSRSKGQHSNDSDTEIENYGSNYADLTFDVDMYMKMSDEEGGGQLLEGDDAGNYDAISPFDSEDRDSDCPAAVRLATITKVPTNTTTNKRPSAEGNENSGVTLLHANSGKQDSSKFEWTKLPLANRRRLIDEILDCEQVHNSKGMESSDTKNSFSSHLVKPKKIDALPFQTLSKQSDIVLPSPMPNFTPSRKSNRPNSRFIGDSNEYHQLNSKKKAESCISPKTKRHCSLNASQANSCFVTPQSSDRPLPCSFFAVGQRSESMDDGDDTSGDVFGSVFSGIF